MKPFVVLLSALTLFALGYFTGQFQNSSDTNITTVVQKYAQSVALVKVVCMPETTEKEQGNYPVAHGTAFVFDEGMLLTNKHVANACELVRGKHTEGGTFKKTVSLYFPGHQVPIEAQVLSVDTDVDLAILHATSLPDSVAKFTFAKTDTLVGSRIVTIGYPLSTIGIAFQNYEDFDAIIAAGIESGAGDIDEIYASEKLIKPTVTTGIVSWATDSRIAYDAVSTHGGSGGPAINMDGTVVGITAAVLNDTGLPITQGISASKITQFIQKYRSMK